MNTWQLESGDPPVYLVPTFWWKRSTQKCVFAERRGCWVFKDVAGDGSKAVVRTRLSLGRHYAVVYAQ